MNPTAHNNDNQVSLNRSLSILLVGSQMETGGAQAIAMLYEHGFLDYQDGDLDSFMALLEDVALKNILRKSELTTIIGTDVVIRTQATDFDT